MKHRPKERGTSGFEGGHCPIVSYPQTDFSSYKNRYHNDPIFRKSVLERVKKWKENNPEKVRGQSRRQAEKRERVPLITLVCQKCDSRFKCNHKDQKYCWDCRNPRCSYCGNSVRLNTKKVARRIWNKHFFCNSEHSIKFQKLHVVSQEHREKVKLRNRGIQNELTKKRYKDDGGFRNCELGRCQAWRARDGNGIRQDIKIEIYKNGLRELPEQLYKMFFIYYLGVKIAGKRNRESMSERAIEFGRGWIEREDKYECKSRKVSRKRR